MRIKLKSTHETERIHISIDGTLLPVRKFWTEVSPQYFLMLMKSHSHVLDFDAPELDLISVREQLLLQKTGQQSTEQSKQTVEPVEIPVETSAQTDKPKILDINELREKSKQEIDEFAFNEYGIQLDRRKSKEDMLKALKKKLTLV